MHSTAPNKGNTSPPNQPKQSQSSTLRKSYEQVVKGNPTRLSSEKPWTEVKYHNKRERMAIIRAEELQHWQRLKVHSMPLSRYLGKGKIELLKREVESSTRIKLKTVSRWLIHENRLRER